MFFGWEEGENMLNFTIGLFAVSVVCLLPSEGMQGDTLFWKKFPQEERCVLFHLFLLPLCHLLIHIHI